DALISRGYDIKDTTKVPASEMQLLRTKSGYDDSRNSYQLALYNYNNATLYAPFDGTIANLFTKEHNVPATSASEPFCTVIGNGAMTVDFTVLESELPAVKKGGSVDVMLFADNSASVKGVITEVNPVVDKNGLVRIKAVVPHPTEAMFDGMNVRVAIRNVVPGQLSVPKTSMVNRSGGRKVVFTYKKGLSAWNYVEEGDDNSSDVIINSGLTEGDTVIVSGNANLTYDVKVKINKILE
ncbi:MAG: efflux RND transporter periplasmic adaptor subunit, partial [Flavobacteriales bacterium]|nr:efflux RND transporter periplasmic adaptor subunit [Flavobacteriales bacterium]